MLSFLFSCPACSNRASTATFPLCHPCHESLLRAPTLCEHCGGLQCPPESCLRPWASLKSSGIERASARYLLIGRGYSVLRSWKTTHGPAFDRVVLGPDAPLPEFMSAASVVIPVPQRLTRSMALGGSPVEKIARHLSRTSGVAFARVLTPGKGSRTRQAERSLQERLTGDLQFDVHPRHARALAGKSVVLVDDFMTSGKTLKAGALALKREGASQVYTYCLGVRPRFARYSDSSKRLESSSPA